MKKPVVDPVTKLVAYYRVSTPGQGESGLGLDGQKAAVLAHAKATAGKIIAEFTEIESGRKADRPQLAKALKHAKHAGAILCIAKLDRLSRNVHFLSGLNEADVSFVCCDNPHATRLTVNILAAVAEDEAARISARTKAALTAYKVGNRVSKRIRDKYPKGVPAKIVRERAGKLGGALPECRRTPPVDTWRKAQEAGRATAAALADDQAASLGPIVRELRREGKTLQEISESLNVQGYVTRRNKPWTHVAVLRLLNRDGA